MVLNIKDAGTDRVVRELAAATGESITVAIRVAVEERLARVRRRNAAATTSDVLTEIIRRGRARAVVDSRGEDEILGYGPDGIPA
ncbi:type II toxin-antitoxin system VapB family antitoxin [Sporichthya polymorpha]|uniref:type II toxin-antitoxin system VapB family antitoxin n=1 Tax=Sporichthya polymorpha TaxID=35751 RepID=UPI0003665819|nr:type II toxin-antitoxin system VapB family antitoxin [Sporichthya polymorpha]